MGKLAVHMAKLIDVRCQKYFMIHSSDYGYQLTAIHDQKNIAIQNKSDEASCCDKHVSSLLMTFLPQLVKKNLHIY